MLKSKLFSYSLVVAMLFSLLIGCSSNNGKQSGGESQSTPAANEQNQQPGSQPKSEEVKYPVKRITALIPFGAGGETDQVARSIAPLAEKELGQPIVLQNKPGATGSVASNEVLQQEADGYTLLIAAENQNLYRTTGIADFSFNDFERVLLLGRAVPVILVKADSKYKTIAELLDDAKANPKKLKMMSTGKVGLTGVVTSMLNREFTAVPFDGSGPGIAGLLGGHVDVGVVGIPTAKQYVESGQLRALAIVNDKRMEQVPDWSALGEEMPEYGKYLPWGPYYGVYVKKGTPEAIVGKLTDAFEKAFKSKEFQDFLTNTNIAPLGLKGQDALDFQNNWESVTNWLLYEAGVAEDPSKFGIPKPQSK